MKIADTLHTFKTCDLDLAAYLILHDLKYIGLEVAEDEHNGKNKAFFIFEDPKQIARDLNRVFVTSSEKRYREFFKFLLREVHNKIKPSFRE